MRTMDRTTGIFAAIGFLFTAYMGGYVVHAIFAPIATGLHKGLGAAFNKAEAHYGLQEKE